MQRDDAEGASMLQRMAQLSLWHVLCAWSSGIAAWHMGCGRQGCSQGASAQAVITLKP